jgi:fatty acid desaturase
MHIDIGTIIGSIFGAAFMAFMAEVWIRAEKNLKEPRVNTLKTFINLSALLNLMLSFVGSIPNLIMAITMVFYSMVIVPKRFERKDEKSMS